MPLSFKRSTQWTGWLSVSQISWEIGLDKDINLRKKDEVICELYAAHIKVSSKTFGFEGVRAVIYLEIGKPLVEFFKKTTCDCWPTLGQINEWLGKQWLNCVASTEVKWTSPYSKI